MKAPATSFLGVPAYAAYYWGGRWLGWDFDREVALWLCRVTASILPWLLFLFFFHRWLGRHTSSALVRDAVFVSLALGSCLYGYGMLFLSHTLSAAAAFGAFMLLYDARHAGRTSGLRAFAAGFLAAGVTLLEYPGVVVSVALSVYALFVVRPVLRLIPFAVGGMIPTAAMMHFQWACFGSPLSPGHLYVESEQFREQHHEGFFGAVGLQWEAIYGLLVHPGAGLFPLTPILVFGAVGLVILAVRRRERADAWGGHRLGAADDGGDLDDEQLARRLDDRAALPGGRLPVRGVGRAGRARAPGAPGAAPRGGRRARPHGGRALAERRALGLLPALPGGDRSTALAGGARADRARLRALRRGQPRRRARDGVDDPAGDPRARVAALRRARRAPVVGARRGADRRSDRGRAGVLAAGARSAPGRAGGAGGGRADHAHVAAGGARRGLEAGARAPPRRGRGGLPPAGRALRRGGPRRRGAHGAGAGGGAPIVARGSDLRCSFSCSCSCS
ncbi:MAG: hypothetical protein M5U28_09605 [Sandaracinaceae bacterium]|nr:hypothetical protein [Sandaracinaceae bacterium]